MTTDWKTRLARTARTAFRAPAWLASAFAALAIALAGPAMAQAPLKIGFGMSLTGPLAAMGKAAVISMQIWAEDVNARGGLLGRKVELVYYDDQTNPATVPGIYSKLLDVDHVDLVISGYGTAVVAPAMPFVMQRNLLFVSLFGLNVNEKFGYDRYFSMMPAGPEPAIGWTAGYFDAAASLTPKAQTIALAGADAEYPHNALEAARAHAKRLGLRIVYDKTYPMSTSDYAPVLRSMAAANPDLVFVATYPNDTVGMIRAANEVGLKARMFGGAMVGTQYLSIKTQLGPLLNGVVSLETFVPEISAKLPTIDAFLKKYQARAAKEGVDPLGYYLPPFAYAEMQVIEQAVRAVGSLDQGKLAEHMHKATFDTVAGQFSFGKNGEWMKNHILYAQYGGITSNDLQEWVKPGRHTVLYPPEYKTGPVRAPFESNRK
jgi:branched-chain amino acid transport system substrate-binding protein